jgi:alkanesulfonate monooxygenase SsuD/methylene tetrahydromethanopterin reductase-like flavin-dependent oxidoreductase (luciferase family)
VKALTAQAEAAGRDPRSLAIVCRGSVNVHAAPQGKDRRPLWGSLDEIREDIRRYAEAGLTELFLEANFQPGGPRIDRVLEMMEALAPSGGA